MSDSELSLLMSDLDYESTQSIDLTTLLPKDVTISGSSHAAKVLSTVLGNLLHALPTPALLVDRAGFVVFANKASGESGAISERTDDVTVQSLFVDPDDAKEAHSSMSKVLSDRRTRSCTGMLRLAKGKIRGRVHFKPLKIAQERLILVLVEDLTQEWNQILANRRHEEELRRARDSLEKAVRERTAELVQTNADLKQEVTKRIRIEKVLRENQQRLQLALTGGGLGLWDWNIQTDQAFWSGRAAEILGYEPGEIELTFSWWKEAVHPDDMQRVRKELTAHLEGQTPFYECEYRVRNKSGEWKWVLARGQVVEREEDGRPLRATGTLLDISEHKRIEETERSVQKIKALGGMASGVAHEVKNPLAVISSAAQILMENGIPQDVLQMCARKIVSAADRARDVLDSLLTFARPLAKVEMKELDLISLVRETFEALRDEMRRQNVQLTTLFQDDILIVTGNRWLLRQVLMNLGMNAFTAMRDGGELSVAVERTKTEALIIAKATRQSGCRGEEGHFSQPFVTSDLSDNTTAFELSLSHHIVKKHSGRIEVEAAGENGATIIIRLPMALPGKASQE